MYLSNKVTKPNAITYHQFLTILWNLNVEHDHNIITEDISITLAEQYIVFKRLRYYSIELAHVVTIIAAKYNEDGNGYTSIKDAAYELSNSYVYDLEKKVLISSNFNFSCSPFITNLSKMLILLKVNKPIGIEFKEIYRYLVWRKTNIYNFFTIILAIKIIKNTPNQQIQPLYYSKYIKLYELFNIVSSECGVGVEDLIINYNIIQNNNYYLG